MRRFRSIAGIVVVSLLVCAVVFPAMHRFNVFANPEFNAYVSPKRGRIVDAQTKQGIADVAVIVSWHYAARGMRTDHACKALHVVWTDRDGAFVTPSVAGEVKRQRGGFLTGNVAYRWRMSVWKDGYIRLADLGQILDLDAGFDASPMLAWATREPSTQWVNGQQQVDPVVLERRDLSPPQKLLYESAILRSIWCPEEPIANKDFLTITRSMMNNSILATCFDETNNVLSRNMVTAFDLLVSDHLSTHVALDAQEGIRKYYHKLWGRMMGSKNGVEPITAGDLCRIGRALIEADNDQADHGVNVRPDRLAERYL